MPFNEPLMEMMNDAEPVKSRTNGTNRGIDLTSALEILSLRSSVLPQNQTIENENPNDFDVTALQHNLNGISSKVGCGCCPMVHGLDEIDSKGITSSQQQHPSGQLIDLGITTLDYDNSNGNTGDKNITTEVKSTMHNEATDLDILDKQEQQKQAQELAVARQEQLASTIHSMTTNDAISAIFHTQEDRVKCYRFFDE